MDGPRWMTWMGARRALPRAVAGLVALAPAGILPPGEAEAARYARKKRRKRCRKQCKQVHQRCDRSCNDLPDGERETCQQECQIARQQCKKAC